MKKFKILLIIYICISMVFLGNSITLADDEEENYTENEIEEINSTVQKEINDVANGLSKFTINSKRYVIYDRKSNLPIYGKDENKQTAMASTTKILTATLILEKCKNLNEEVIIETKAANVGGSRLGLKVGDKITVNDLLYGLLLRSGNDAAVALAIHTGGSIQGFATLMNEKAQELGLTNSHFVTPHGLDDPKHYTTAVELAIITDYALNNTKFSEIVKLTSASITINGNPRTITNTNEVLCSNVEGVYGVKTGFTNNAGRCLVTSVKRDNMDLIIVVLMADTRQDRAKDTIKLIDYAFKEFRMEDVEAKINEQFETWKQINENRIFIYKAREKLQTELSDYSIKKIATNQEVKIEVNSITYLEAPVMEKTKVGTISVKNGDNLIENIDILVSKTINKKGIMDYISMFGRAVVL